MACCSKVPPGVAGRASAASRAASRAATKAANAAAKACPPGGCKSTAKKTQPKTLQASQVKPCHCREPANILPVVRPR